MLNGIEKNQTNTQIIKAELFNTVSLDSLQYKIDKAEKSGEVPFSDFNDIEMMKWFLYERKHLNSSNDRSSNTISEYERELLMFVNQVHTYSLEIDVDLDYIIEGSFFKSLQSRHLRRYQEWLATKSPHVLKNGAYSAATLERKTTIIRAFFHFLYEKQYIQEPISKGLRIASTRKDDRPNRDLGPKDVVALLNSFRDNHHPIMFTIVLVLTTTGIRNEEFCTLTIADLKNDSIQEGQYLKVTGKGNKMRHVPLKEKVANSIRMFRHARGLPPIEEANPQDPLFTTNTGKAFSPSYLSQYVKKEITKLETPSLSDQTVLITPHVFRHAFAIISKLNGVDIYEIMRSLGHEKIETTMIYLEKVFEKERHAIHKWDSASFGQFI